MWNEEEMPITDDDFKKALKVYEKFCSLKQGMSNRAALDECAVSMTEDIYQGFRDRFDLYSKSRQTDQKKTIVGQLVRKEGGRTEWYRGAHEYEGEWPKYRTAIQERLPESAVNDIDESTTRILAECANPGTPGEKHKGLVIGYVQSGKTANYAGLIAKSIDEGYRIIIVLSGMHSNLRSQTQERLDRDLEINKIDGSGATWIRLTDTDSDIAPNITSTAVNNAGNTIVMVVKKNTKRLENVASFLSGIPDPILSKRPVLLIDDESDQATPNTMAAKNKISAINRLIREIWSNIRTGSYVAYTATPFANVFIDPNDKKDLYPEDFVYVLPRPSGYMGAAEFFDLAETDDTDNDAIELRRRNITVEVDKEESQILTVSRDGIEAYQPVVTHSLEEAIRWFLIATTIRRIRTTGARLQVSGQQTRDGNSPVDHSSMLIHTSHRVEAHQRLKDVVEDFIRDTQAKYGKGIESSEFKRVYESHVCRSRLSDPQAVIPRWEDVHENLEETLSQVTLRIDNGNSKERLSYPDGVPQTVIAIGGGTLSRGLTLEGLVVSYFLRTSNSYDTLLQMGRWFGFRPGYKDLVRVWVGPGLMSEYAHLAIVEKQLRDEIRELQVEGKTPRDVGIKILSHPGRLQITSANKMTAASIVRAGLGGTRRQTIYLDTSDESRSLQRKAVNNLITNAVLRKNSQILRRPSDKSGAKLITGLRASDISAFLEEYWISSREPWLQSYAFNQWVEEHAARSQWSILMVAGAKGGTEMIEYPQGIRVRSVSRTPLKPEYWDSADAKIGRDEPESVRNFRALMSGGDYLLDLRILSESGLLSAKETEALNRASDAVKFHEKRKCRREISPNSGVVILYGISGSSRVREKDSLRENLDLDSPLFGISVIFPNSNTEFDGDYYSVHIEPAFSDSGEDDDFIGVDDEADYVDVPR
jgi:hypothetical protein